MAHWRYFLILTITNYLRCVIHTSCKQTQMLAFKEISTSNTTKQIHYILLLLLSYAVPSRFTASNPTLSPSTGLIYQCLVLQDTGAIDTRNHNPSPQVP